MPPGGWSGRLPDHTGKPADEWDRGVARVRHAGDRHEVKGDRAPVEFTRAVADAGRFARRDLDPDAQLPRAVDTRRGDRTREVYDALAGFRVDVAVGDVVLESVDERVAGHELVAIARVPEVQGAAVRSHSRSVSE